MAPPGSSMPKCSSSHSTENGTSAPATSPIMTASGGLAKAHAALPATRPPTQPLAVSDASGLPKRTRVMITAGGGAAGPGRDGVVLTPPAAPPGAPGEKKGSPAV